MMKISKERFAVGSFQYFRYPLEYFLDIVQELGFTSIDLWGAAPHFCLDVMSAASVIRKAAEIRRRGLKVFCLTPEQVNYPLNLAAEDEEFREYSLRMVKRAVDAAEAALECPNVLVTAGCGYFNGNHEEQWKRSRESLADLCEYARRRNIVLLLETLTPPSSNILNTPQQQRQMIEEIGTEQMIPVMDLGQMVSMSQSLEKDYLEEGCLPGHVHLHDVGDALHMALGDGRFPVAEILESLEKSGYKGMYTLECNDARYRKDPAASDRKNLAWLEATGIL